MTVPHFVRQVMKSLAAFRCQVVKLFAKHLKMDEQRKMLRKGCFPLAVSVRQGEGRGCRLREKSLVLI